MKSQSLTQNLFFILLFTILTTFVLSITCPQEFTEEVNYTNAKERYTVSLKKPGKSSVENPIETHYTYLRDCMNRILVYSSQVDYYGKINNTKISENQDVIYILEIVNIYFGWFDPRYVDEKLSKLEIVNSAEKDQKVSIN
ncbi:17500_t:CDS:1 [Funneliformis geosporum]|uniref:14033_t:CDS:1 n=1 Tax=Funneliformis geosporum TaxID=1117311 RepID=A0A9W4WHA6_9GLOM|nr:14033_t:CDS:1 [Funneliformis geosporum]CAI2163718.1 17500_t:CDS:1 [Funneliformis geosporum]